MKTIFISRKRWKELEGDEKKMDISIIQSESRYLLCIGSEKVEVSDSQMEKRSFA